MLLAATGAALLIGITVHEFSHALAASRLGDTTARRLGRLSLNPLRHLDPLGTAMLLLVGFGWGKPVPVNPVAFGPRARQGMSLVALSGPLANLATAAVVAIPFKAGVLPWGFLRLSVFPLRGGEELLAALLGYVVFYNLILAVFNLIPLAPLDGFSVALGLLPRDLANAFARLERYGPAILLVVILLDMVVGFGILGRVIYPIVNALGNVFVGRRLL
ncbi:MAG: site-2 protease family protein [Chloroflexi bacterium]|nr:site-2 protease family protein [Chloroflexota bacterium]